MESTRLFKSIERGDFGSLSDNQALDYLHEAFEAELKLLAGAGPAVESQSSKMNQDTFPSYRIFKKNYDEVNRTLASLLSVKWLLGGDYDAFTAPQKHQESRLEKDSFRKFVERFSLLSCSGRQKAENIRDLLVAIVVNDLGKCPSIKDEVEKLTGKASTDHDAVLYDAASRGLIPVLRNYPKDNLEDLMLGFKFGGRFNIAQFVQAENVPESLKWARIMKGHERAYELKFLEVFFDVAGALGHQCPKGSPIMNKDTFNSYVLADDILKQSMCHGADFRKQYDRLLAERATLLEKDGFGILSANDPGDRTLLRLMIMARVFKCEQALHVKKAFEDLADGTKRSLEGGLNRPILFYYAPSVLSGALRALSRPLDSSTSNPLGEAMALIARIYDAKKALIPDTKVLQVDMSKIKHKVGEVESIKDSEFSGLEHFILPDCDD